MSAQRRIWNWLRAVQRPCSLRDAVAQFGMPRSTTSNALLALAKAGHLRATSRTKSARYTAVGDGPIWYARGQHPNSIATRERYAFRKGVGLGQGQPLRDSPQRPVERHILDVCWDNARQVRNCAYNNDKPAGTRA